MQEYKWDKIIGSIVYGRGRAAAHVGLTVDELKAEGRLAAVEAMRTWRSDGGRSASSWVWMQVSYAITKALIEASKHLTEAYHGHLGEDPDPDSVLLIRQALGYLQAKLADPEWTMLWLQHAEGRNLREIAEMMGMTKWAVQKKIQRVRGKAVSILEKRGIALFETA